MFRKILVANRGEIAVRIIRACKEMGILTVAVFSTADRDALHVSLADESYCIGGPSVTESYLNMGAVITAAVVTGAEAIHPGYGLLSENSVFAALCDQCNIVFIGPSAESIAMMGDKNEARLAMIKANVPVIPGTEILADPDEAERRACDIGYPILIKARSGGGGRGIRLVKAKDELRRNFQAAAAEAEKAFGDPGLYLEKYLTGVKHIEMQILADKSGNVICLGERDCSAQRRNQKLMEESPSVAIDDAARAELVGITTAAVKSIGYHNAGTIEYLYDGKDGFYFMEMNTRLQVEHPVTEMVTGIDLVQWQIRIAYGLVIPFTQQDIELKGHAIECRINAEDPEHDFRPQCGTIETLHIPGGPGVRFDSAVYRGYSIPPYYDSMIGKLIVHSGSRSEALRKMHAALCELVIGGIAHNADLQRRILKDKRFISGKYDTGLISSMILKPEVRTDVK
ncbi:acetyl-CoA carboxylase biotin carboxylase subunit [Candidatus Nomurabacteria bacterium]|nr:acetyl-CoA carboxylase biotin carboxylase subunit [Candidatus Nomurabacteria bacterium]